MSEREPLAGSSAPAPRRIPNYLWGQTYAPSDSEHEVEFPSGRKARFALVGPEFADALAAGVNELAALPLHDIVGFLKNVGRNWKSKENTRRRLYVRALCEFKGYSEKAAQNEANWIAMLLCSDYRLYDTLAAELGSWQVMDEWVAREEVYLKAVPVGRVLHILPGNVPQSAVVSMLRAILTKNLSVVKMAAEDPFTPIALLQSFADVDPRHPVTRSISTCYWPSASAYGEPIAHHADAVIAWGGSDAMSWAGKHAGPGTEVIKFGPKRSAGFIGATTQLREAARKAAFDICLYDQRACFSVRQLFVERSVYPAFVAALEQALAEMDGILPKGLNGLDEAADQALTRAEWQFFDARCSDPAHDWAIIEADPGAPLRHCLGRTVFVHPVERLEDGLAHLDGSVQTVGFFPWEAAHALRDGIAARGVSRIVELGMHNVFRSGGSHDGMFPLQRLVRFISHERPAASFVKGINVRIDQTDFMAKDRFVEFIP